MRAVRSASAAAFIVAAVIGLHAESARAITSCSFVGTVGVSFGIYDVFSPVPLTSLGALTYRCSGVNAGDTVVIELSAGDSGDARARSMAGPGASLSYNLYLDAARTLIWGNGSGTARYGPTTPPSGEDVVVHVFGAVVEGQRQVVAGSYTDHVTATILF